MEARLALAVPVACARFARGVPGRGEAIGRGRVTRAVQMHLPVVVTLVLRNPSDVTALFPARGLICHPFH